jgi:hypothetical protein
MNRSYGFRQKFESEGCCRRPASAKHSSATAPGPQSMPLHARSRRVRHRQRQPRR